MRKCSGRSQPDGYLRMKGIEMDLAWYKERNLLKTDIKLQDAVDNIVRRFRPKGPGQIPIIPSRR
jgi:NitT/TauT family transport system substrate-binding protein